MRAAGWHHYTEVESQHVQEHVPVLLRRTPYEQPGFLRILLCEGSEALMTLRVMGDDRVIVELPLRRLVYHGLVTSGALHADELYVIKSP